ncbi:calycin-like domain-containing protein [Treponema sp. Marseille-Q4130]|uniref:calycin-like domain-containing protein n=1 Tax=Treponema sp. Marseille-Q4130 TaxID=2766702 RepID=UPI001652A26F|nr:calycin-like domain-containing protein [Treponema sp. Marseille-Q4130]MBC6720747.1 hypothetical protein [Treponema sp. Marseille-Q4130]
MKKRLYGFFAAAALASSLLCVSCDAIADAFKDETLEPVDISELYGYTYYGSITPSGGTTLKPALTIYNSDRLDWNMSVNGMTNNQFYYYSVKNSKNNYTLYWFGGADSVAAMAKDASKAAMTVQIGINSTDGITILLTGDGLTGIGAMSNTRVPMSRQVMLGRAERVPDIAFDPSIQDVTIEIPSDAAAADWGGSASYTGTFDYLVGPGGSTARGHGSCGAGIEPKITLTSDGTHTVKLGMHRFINGSGMTIEAYDIPGVRVSEKDGVYYLKRDPAGVPANIGGVSKTLNDLTVCGKLEGGKLTLRVEFKPGRMPFPIIEIFTGN